VVIKKILSKKAIVFMLIVCLTSLPLGTVSASKVSDIQGSWAEAQISKWMEKGLISGYPDGGFKPDHSITRAELVALINKSFGFVELEERSFKDVKASDWYYSSLLAANAAGYIQGYSDGSFGPNKKVTRQEFAVIVSKLLALPSSDSANKFSDTSTSPLWSKVAIGSVYDKGIMSGYSDNTFHPESFTTRAEAVVILDRSLTIKGESSFGTLSYDIAGTYGPATGEEKVSQNVIINSSDVTLQNMTILGNLLLAEGIAEGEVFLKNVTVNGVTTVSGGGAHSVHFENARLTSVIIDKKTGIIRIVVEGSTVISDIQVQSPATIQSSSGATIHTVTLSKALPKDSQMSLLGSFKNVIVLAQNINIGLPQGSVQNFSFNKDASGNKLNNGASILSLIMNASTNVVGNGTIDQAVINASGITMEHAPRNLEAGKDVPSNVNVNIGGVNRPAATPTQAPAVTTPISPVSPGTSDGTVTPTATPAATPTATPTATPAATPTATPAATPTATPVATPAVTPTATPAATPTATPAATPTATPTAAPTETPTVTPSATPDVTPLPTLSPTFTPEPTPPGPTPQPEQYNVNGTIIRADGKEIFKEGILYISKVQDNMTIGYETKLVDGKFSINLYDGDYQITKVSDLNSSDFISLFYTFKISDEKPIPSSLDIVIPEGHEGTIKYQDGTSISNGSLSMLRIEPNLSVGFSAPIKDGKFTLYLPDGDYLIKNQNNYATEEQISLYYTFKIVNGLTEPSQIDIVIPSKIKGTIVNSEGVAVPSGTLMVHRTDTPELSIYYAQIYGGNYSLFLPDGSYQADGFYPVNMSSRISIDYRFTVNNGKTTPNPLAITIPKGYNGTIKNADGRIFRYGSITVYKNNEDGSQSFYTAPIFSGEFKLFLPEGTYQVNSLFNGEDQIPFNYTFTIAKGQSDPNLLNILVP
jgi:hypothetical protein